MTDTAPPKEQITFEDLVKIDIRVGTITEVSDIAESKKLVRLKVDLGFATRTVVVGMKQEREDPREVEGSQALFVVNLPRGKWPALSRKRCSSTWAIPTRSCPRWPFRNAASPMGRVPGESRPGRNALARVAVAPRTLVAPTPCPTFTP